MINIRAAVTAVASVAVATATVAHLIRNNPQTTTAIVETPSVDPMQRLMAFGIAQDEVSRRMLDGYYDDKPDAEYTNDFTVIYNTLIAV